jgi:hypothetical protein
MFCLGVPIQVAVVDRIEEDWALVELAQSRVVEVELSRLPVGAREGSSVCYCPLEGQEPRGFRTCPVEAGLNFNPKRRSQWRF